LGPRNPVTFPVSTSKDKSETATFLRYFLVRWLALITYNDYKEMFGLNL
jgi:hypothetical protein